MPTLTTETRDHLLLIGLNRPEKYNAFNLAMLRELAEAYTRLEEDSNLWCGLLFATFSALALYFHLGAGPVIAAPAMNDNMWRHPATRANVETLKSRGVTLVGIEPERERGISFVADDLTEGRFLESRDDRGLVVGRKLVEKLETGLGDIPVYPSVREVMKNGHTFDTGVIYLPPSAVAQAVSELVSHNHELKRIIIITEIPVCSFSQK